MRAQIAIADLIGPMTPGDRRKALWDVCAALVPTDHPPRFMPSDLPKDQATEYTAFELEHLYNAQSIGFTVEMMPYIFPLLSTLPIHQTYTCLDVGTRTGAGANLFGSLFASNFTGMTIKVDTIDTDSTFAEYQRSRYFGINEVKTGDVFDVPDGSYDMVMCSHTLEHIPDPIPFAKKLTTIARRFAFFYCPYNEQDTIPGNHSAHHCVDDAVVDALSPTAKYIFKSWFWRKGDDHATQQCVFFVTRP